MYTLLEYSSLYLRDYLKVKLKNKTYLFIINTPTSSLQLSFIMKSQIKCRT